MPKLFNSERLLFQTGMECPGESCWIHSGSIKVKVPEPGHLWESCKEVKNKFQEEALANSTAKNYKSWHRRYQEFLVKCGKAEKKDDPEKVATFLAHVAESAGGLGGVNMARSALSQLFKFEGFNEDKNPALSPQVNLVIKGIHRKFKKPTEKKEAISLAQLEKVIRTISKNYNWEVTDLPNHRLAALITLMFATAARFEEAKDLKCGQLVLEENRCIVQFRKGKTYQFGENRTSVIENRAGESLNPLSLIRGYVARLQVQEMGKDDDFLFPNLVKKGAAISYEAARDQFRKGLKAAGIENIEKFGLHSMRRGSVTALTQAGVSDHLVQKHMRVVSNSTVRRYATLSHEKLGKISRVVFRA